MEFSTEKNGFDAMYNDTSSSKNKIIINRNDLCMCLFIFLVILVGVICGVSMYISTTTLIYEDNYINVELNNGTVITINNVTTCYPFVLYEDDARQCTFTTTMHTSPLIATAFILAVACFICGSCSLGCGDCSKPR